MNTTEFQGIINQILSAGHGEQQLTVLLPPGNIEAELERTQAALFAACGDRALRYLSPCIPLGAQLSTLLRARTGRPAGRRVNYHSPLRYLPPLSPNTGDGYGILSYDGLLEQGPHESYPLSLVLAISSMTEEVLSPILAELNSSPERSFKVAAAAQLVLQAVWDGPDAVHAVGLHMQITESELLR